MAIIQLKELATTRAASVEEIETAQHVIPSSDALDKVLRYETSIERNLSRALERLEKCSEPTRMKTPVCE